MRPGLFQKHYALCDDVLVCILFSRSLVLLVFNLFSPLLFQLVYREFSNCHFITCIKNPARLLGWSFLQKQLKIECPLLFLQKSPSQMFDEVFNAPLRWCIRCNLDGVFLLNFQLLAFFCFTCTQGISSLFFVQHFYISFEAALPPFYLF